MKLTELLNEGTELELHDGTVIAKRVSLRDGPAVQMFVTKDRWNEIKNQQANIEGQSYDLATAESIVNDWVKDGAEVQWKTAADFNKDARDLEQHRFRNDPNLRQAFDQEIDRSRSAARDVTRRSLRTV